MSRPCCSVPGCDKPRRTRGYCEMHYKRVRRSGSPDGMYGDVEARFFSRLVEDSLTGCWEWQACLNRDGYGEFKANDKKHLAHRWAYEFLRSEIPHGLVIDHLCLNKKCCNPWHLEPVTLSVNAKRAAVLIPRGPSRSRTSSQGASKSSSSQHALATIE